MRCNNMCYVLCIYQYEATTLIRSVYNGNIEILNFLIDNGALPSINTPDNVNI